MPIENLSTGELHETNLDVLRALFKKAGLGTTYDEVVMEMSGSSRPPARSKMVMLGVSLIQMAAVYGDDSRASDFDGEEEK